MLCSEKITKFQNAILGIFHFINILMPCCNYFRRKGNCSGGMGRSALWPLGALEPRNLFIPMFIKPQKKNLFLQRIDSD